MNDISLEQNVNTILDIYGYNEVKSLIRDTHELFDLYDLDEDDGSIRDPFPQGDHRQVRLLRTAFLLSRLAHGHAVLLAQVIHKASNFYLNAEHLAKLPEKKVFRDGLTLC